jgi:hypothetical protein
LNVTFGGLNATLKVLDGTFDGFNATFKGLNGTFKPFGGPPNPSTFRWKA